MRKIPKRFICQICGRKDCVEVRIHKKSVILTCGYCGELIEFLEPLINPAWEPVDYYKLE